jgi:two-component system chemotaxis response regulator CheB
VSASFAAAEPLPREALTRVVVVAASTGGPAALARLVGALPRALGAAVLVAQHMPAGFTATLAKRLHSIGPLPASEAGDGDVLEADRVYVAPGGSHLVVERDGAAARLRLDHGPAVWGVRPAADLLFASAAAIFGAGVVGVVLTGMGRDGAAGLRAVRDAGGHALVQDRASSVVYGMPHAAMQLAGADRELALGDVAGAIVDALATLGSSR